MKVKILCFIINHCVYSKLGGKITQNSANTITKCEKIVKKERFASMRSTDVADFCYLCVQINQRKEKVNMSMDQNGSEKGGRPPPNGFPDAGKCHRNFRTAFPTRDGHSLLDEAAHLTDLRDTTEVALHVSHKTGYTWPDRMFLPSLAA